MTSLVSLRPLYQVGYNSQKMLLDQEASQANFSDTNDYESAPNFEASTGIPFGKLVQLGLGPSVR
jgi:hypothetical protein